MSFWGHKFPNVSAHRRVLEISCEREQAALGFGISREGKDASRAGFQASARGAGPAPHPIQLTCTGGQPADLNSVWLVPLTLPETVGVGPAHHLSLLDALSAGGRALWWEGQATSQQPGEGCRGDGWRDKRKGVVSSRVSPMPRPERCRGGR